MERVVEKYDGVMNIELEERMFIVSIMLYI